MRARYLGALVVTYVKTKEAGKAASHIFRTSANAAHIVPAMEGDTLIKTPDKDLAQNVARMVPHQRVMRREGSCIVHERCTAQDLREFRAFSAIGCSSPTRNAR
ncbi:quinolinate synthase NadA [Cypionkella psychrotolerans]|uniref:quinolinate synthase NadA n=1 Tax=Cypionkella psychrotolerans TaxID=1678131 RepID=UPI000A4529BD